MNRIKKRKLGYVLWITGLPGSGKTSIAKKINNHYKKKNFDFLEISGDEIRKVLKFDNYDKKSRKQYAKSYARLCKILSEKGVNVIISTVSLFHEIHKWNKKNIKNYKEVYIKSDLNQIIKNKKKKFYFNNKIKNIVSKNIKAEYPLNPNIIIENNFKESIEQLSKKVIKKLRL